MNFDVPAGACDCHTHIHADPEKFPFYSGRVYTPELASPEEMSALHKALHIERVVIVTPSVYGPDNSATLFGMKARGATARGVAVIDDKTSEADLDAMQAAGFRGIRLNLATGGVNDPNVGRARLSGRGRSHEGARLACAALHHSADDLGDQGPGRWLRPCRWCSTISAARRRELGVDQPGFADLVELVKSGKAYVKISGAYRASKLAPDYPDAAPLAKALIAANAERIVWGTDWPHPDSVTLPGASPPTCRRCSRSTTGRCLNQLPVWAPDAATRKTILVDNPARLYGFG